MAKLRFKKPKIAVLMSEIITLTIWLFLGDEVIDVLDTIIGTTVSLNITDGSLYPANTNIEGCTNGTIFEDAYEIMGLGYSCDSAVAGTSSLADISNTGNGLLGVIGLVMVVMVLMNFVSYN